MSESQDEFDWSLLERTQECLREHMKEIHHLRKKLSELREWQSLTDEEIDEMSHKMVKGDQSVNWLCRVIEVALKEKNT